MRTLILSDVHANLNALKAVLNAAQPFERVWCLGDVVGYGPDPNECIEIIRSLPLLKCVKGNHDAAILGEIDTYTFNIDARLSLEWLMTKIQPENLRWLGTLPERLTNDKITIVHGSPRNPVWEYVMDLGTARANMSEFDTPVCLVGHTHYPCIYHTFDETIQSTQLTLLSPGDTFSVQHKAIINPGSVGQPRDHDPRAAFMIYEDETDQWHFHRVDYDIGGVQKRIREAGLPSRHASRLSQGW